MGRLIGREKSRENTEVNNEREKDNDIHGKRVSQAGDNVKIETDTGEEKELHYAHIDYR